MRVKFDFCFPKKKGMYTVVTPLRCNGIIMYPGISFTGKDFNVGGVNWKLFLDRDLEVDIDGNTLVITGIY